MGQRRRANTTKNAELSCLGPRTVTKLIRFRPDEVAAVASRARESGMPVAKFIRCAAVGATLRAKQTREHAEVIRSLASIGNRLHQLVNLAREQEQSEALAAEVRATLDEVLAVIGRVG